MDAVFRSLHFEKITIPDEYTGTPADACQKLNRQIADISRKIEDLNKEAADMLVKKAPQIVAAKQRLEELAHNFDVRKMAAGWKIRKKTTTFYAAGCQKTTLPALWKKSRMMTRYCCRGRRPEHFILEILRSAAEPEAVQTI